MLITSFDKIIRFNGDTFQFRFYGFNTAGSGKRFLIAAHNHEEHFVFHMKLAENGMWGIVNDAPSWVDEISNELSEMIIKEMKNVK